MKRKISRSKLCWKKIQFLLFYFDQIIIRHSSELFFFLCSVRGPVKQHSCKTGPIENVQRKQKYFLCLRFSGSFKNVLRCLILIYIFILVSVTPPPNQLGPNYIRIFFNYALGIKGDSRAAGPGTGIQRRELRNEKCRNTEIQKCRVRKMESFKKDYMYTVFETRHLRINNILYILFIL